MEKDSGLSRSSLSFTSGRGTYGVLMRPGIWQASGPTEEQQWLPERKTKEHSPCGKDDWGRGPPLWGGCLCKGALRIYRVKGSVSLEAIPGLVPADTEDAEQPGMARTMNMI